MNELITRVLLKPPVVVAPLVLNDALAVSLPHPEIVKHSSDILRALPIVETVRVPLHHHFIEQCELPMEHSVQTRS